MRQELKNCDIIVKKIKTQLFNYLKNIIEN